MTKNITLAIDEDLLQKVRVLAAMRKTSVNKMVRAFLKREIEKEAGQASRAEVWARQFESADQGVTARQRRLEQGEQIFDRETFYEEVMRERGLL